MAEADHDGIDRSSGAVSHEYAEMAEYYDAWYAAVGKDPAAEVEAVLALLADLGHPRPESLLDVACGTGRHLAHFRRRIPQVAGTDLSEHMLAVARARLPDVRLSQSDFGGTDMGRRFEVVTCLGSSIGHVHDAGHLDRAIGSMAGHLAAGGIVVIEPWLTPELIVADGVRHGAAAKVGDDWVTRTSSSRPHGNAILLERVWSVATSDGVRTRQETLRMPVFSRDRLVAAVTNAGLTASWHDDERFPRGILAGRTG